MDAGALDEMIIREILPHNAADLRIDCTPRTPELRPRGNRASDSRYNPRPCSNNRPVPDCVDPPSFSWTGILVLIRKFTGPIRRALVSPHGDGRTRLAGAVKLFDPEDAAWFVVARSPSSMAEPPRSFLASWLPVMM
jgi:hypothetical protein